MRWLKLFEDFDSSTNITVERLSDILLKNEVPIQFWGKGESKTVDSLLHEIINKDSILSKKGNYLVRLVEFVGIRVLYKDRQNNTWLLVEDRQEFNDGRIRRRKMPSSVNEKMKFGEDSLVAAIRGLREELELSVESSQLKKHRPLYYNGSSQSYPGLRTEYKGHQYTCYLNESQFKYNGYVEIQDDKSTFFKWIKKS